MQRTERAETHLPDCPDGIFVQQALAGDQQAFEALVQRYSTSLFSFIYHILGDYDQACDVLQQVLLKFYLSLPILRINEPLKPWLFQVARNRSIDHLRRQRTIPFSQLETANDDEMASLLATIPDNTPLPEELAEYHDLQEQLQRAIHALPPKFCSVVLLRYLSQMTFAEIGRVLGMPEATAKTYFQRSKALLRISLREVVSGAATYA